MKTKKVMRAMQDILGQTPLIEVEVLIDQLMSSGFDLADIQKAMEIIYSFPDVLTGVPEFTLESSRVFNELERFRYPVTTQNYLFGLLRCGLLTQSEFEQVVFEGLSLDTLEIGIPEIQWIIGHVVNDQERAMLLSGSFGQQ